MRKSLPAILRWLTDLVKSDFAQNFGRDLKSLRALWNYVYLALYAWICVWAVLHHPEAVTTAITVTGSVVSVIFTGYVFSKTYEKTRNGKYPVEFPRVESEEESDA